MTKSRLIATNQNKIATRASPEAYEHPLSPYRYQLAEHLCGDLSRQADSHAVGKDDFADGMSWIWRPPSALTSLIFCRRVSITSAGRGVPCIVLPNGEPVLLQVMSLLYISFLIVTLMVFQYQFNQMLNFRDITFYIPVLIIVSIESFLRTILA